MTCEAFVYRARVAIPALGIDAGDDVVLHDGAPRLLTLCKTVDDQRAFYRATETGLLEPLAGAPLGRSLYARLPHLPRVPTGRLTRVPTLVLIEGGAR